MNWFDKHLNWMTACMLVGSVGLLSLFIWLSFGFHFPYWADIFAFATPTLILLALLVISWLLLNALAFGWILYRKKRSLVFLIVLLPELFAVIGGIIYKLFWFSAIRLEDDIVNGAFDYIETNYAVLIATTLVLVFSIRWIIPLLLKNKNVVISDNQSATNKTILKI